MIHFLTVPPMMVIALHLLMPLSGGTNTLNFTSAGDSPTSSTPATNAGPHTTAAGQPTGMQYVMQVVN